MPGLNMTVTTSLTPSPRDLSPALAIALPLMKQVNLMPLGGFENIAFNTDKSEERREKEEKKTPSRQQSTDSDKDKVRVRNYKNDCFKDINGVIERVNARTPLLRGHKIESLDESKLKESNVEKRKSSAST